MLPDDFNTRFIDEHPNTLQGFLDEKKPLGFWSLVVFEGTKDTLVFASEEAATDEVALPDGYRDAVLAELAKPRQGDELVVFVVRRDRLLGTTRISRAQIEREIGPVHTLDARNHLPARLPRDWEGPYLMPGFEGGLYRVDTPDCQILARITRDWDYADIDGEGNPRAVERFEIGVTRAFDSALPSDEQIAALAARMRNCGPFEDRTRLAARVHPSRRIFAARVGGHRGVAWAELRPLPELLGPPPAWEPDGTLHARPLVFRIAGTKLRVAWSPPGGVDPMTAATGRSPEPSRFVVTREGKRAPNDEEIGIVFQTLGAQAYAEAKRPRAAAKASRERVFTTTAGWLRPRPPVHS